MNTHGMLPSPAGRVSDLQRLRLERGVTQRAFSRLTGITQSELSRLENGKVERPQERTVAAYVKHCGVTTEEFHAALLATVRRFSDPAQAATSYLENRIRELFPRKTEGQQMDLAGHLIGLGRDLYRASDFGDEIRWFQLAGVAEECLFSMRHAELRGDFLLNALMVTSSLQAVMQMCAGERTPEAAVDPATFRTMLLGLLSDDGASQRNSNGFEKVFEFVLPVTRRYRDGFLRAEEAFDEKWSELQLESLEQRDLLRNYAMLTAGSLLLSGVADAAREEPDERVVNSPDLVHSQ